MQTKYNQTQVQKSFSENRAIFLQGKPYPGLNQLRNAQELNNAETASKFNIARQSGAKKEYLDPVLRTVDTTVGAVNKLAGKIINLPGRAVSGVLETTKSAVGTVLNPPLEIIGNAISQVSATTAAAVGGTLGFATKVPRLAADFVRGAARAPLILSDYLAEAIGYPSRIVRRTQERAINVIDKTSGRITSLRNSVKDKADAALSRVKSTLTFGQDDGGLFKVPKLAGPHFAT